MNNVKIKKGLVGSEWWKGALVVEVAGDPHAAEFPKEVTPEEKEEIIQSWKTVAVFAVEPKDAGVRVGFISGDYVGMLISPIELADGKFGMRIGKGNAKFFAFEKDLQTEVQLVLVEVTKEDDPKYTDLPLY